MTTSVHSIAQIIPRIFDNILFSANTLDIIFTEFAVLIEMRSSLSVLFSNVDSLTMRLELDTPYMILP